MDDQEHIIGKSQFEVQATSKEKALTYQDRIIHYFNTELSEAIAQVFSEYSDAELHTAIEHLEIDAGDIPEDELERTLKTRVLEALRLELDKLKLRTARPLGEEDLVTIRDQASTRLGYLKYYLLYGELPWKIQGKPIQIEDLLIQLIRQVPGQFIAMMRQLGSKEHVRRRMVFQFGEEQLQKIITVLEPAQAGLILDYLHELEEEQQREQLVKAESSDFKQAKYYFALTYLLVERGSMFNTKSFIRSLIRQMAAHYNVSYPDILFQLLRHEAVGFSIRNSLPGIVRAIFMEDIQPDQPDRLLQLTEPALLEKNRDVLGEVWEENLLLQFLDQPGFSEHHFHISKNYLHRIFEKVLKDKPGLLLRKLAPGQAPKMAAHLLQHFSESHIQGMIGLYEPSQQDWIWSALRQLEQAAAQHQLLRGAGIRQGDLVMREFTLRYLIEQRGKVFDKKTFLHQLLRFLVKATRRPPADLMVAFRQIPPGPEAYGLEVFLQKEFDPSGQSKDETFANAQDPDASIKTSDADRTLAEISVLKYFLSHGNLPWWNEDVRDQQHLAELWKRYLQDDPQEELLYFVKEQSLYDHVRQNVLQLLKAHDYAETPLFLLAFEGASPANVSVLTASDWTQIRHETDSRVFSVLLELYLLFYTGHIRDTGQLMEWILKTGNRYSVNRYDFYKSLEHLRQQVPSLQMDTFFVFLVVSESREDQVPLPRPETPVAPPKPTKTATTQSAEDLAAALAARAAAASKPEGEPSGTPFPADAKNYSLTESGLYAHARVEGPLRELLEVWTFFLRYGKLSPNYSGNLNELVAALFQQLQADGRSLMELMPVLSFLRMRTVRMHLINGLDETHSILFLRLLFFRQSQLLADFSEDFVRVLQATEAFRRFGVDFKQVFERILIYASHNASAFFNPRNYTLEIVRELFRPAARYHQFLQLTKMKILQRELTLTTFLSSWLVWAREQLPQQKQTALAGKKEQDETMKEEAEEPVQKFTYVENAGMVLLWPFLSHYYKLLDLLDESGQKFKDKTSAVRAAQLLQYLASGELHAPEYHLVLNKHLCGLEQQTPVDTRMELSEQEIEISNQLLQAVIQQWPILKNTSIDGLRETFLMRKGKLEYKEDNLLLTVEKKTVDILIDHIGWSISTVRLAWMKTLLHVKWR